MGILYKSIKVTVAPLGGGRYRSRIEEYPAGASIGAGVEFMLALDQPLGKSPSVNQVLSEIDNDASTRGRLQTFGSELFSLVFAGSVGQKYYAVSAVAKTQQARLRLCFSILAPELIGVPWEYLCDNSGFLLDHGHSIVRVLDELDTTKSSFSPIQKLLCAASSPRGYGPFGAKAHLDALVKCLRHIGGLEVVPLYPATVEGLHEKLKSQDFDAFYFIGHGEASGDGGHLVCESPQGEPDPLQPHKLAGWLRDAANLRFVFLNSCCTAKSTGPNVFSGIAQKLMLDGNIAAIAAMQVEVGVDAALQIAKAFFTELKRNSPPEDAIQASRMGAGDDYSFGIPVLYSYVDAPEQWETNRIMTILSAQKNSQYALLLPSFFCGELEESPARPRKPKEKYVFKGETFAIADVEAAWYVIGLLQKITSIDSIRILPQSDAAQAVQSNLFVFGARSNPVVSGVLKKSARFEFNYTPDGHPNQWSLKDAKTGKELLVTAPYTLGARQYANVDDFGVIEKIVDEKTGKTYFVLAGFGARATKACGYYLATNWEKLLDQHGNKPFQLILKAPAALPFHDVELIELK